MSRLLCKLLLAALCCLPLALNAQLAVGAKGGVNFAQQEVNSALLDQRITYNAGLAFNLYLAEFSFGGFALQPEVLYSNKGSMQQVSDGVWTDKLSYVEVPVGLTYLLNFGSVVPYISVAPYYAFLVSQKSEIRGLEEAINLYKNADYGIKIGGGLELQKFQISAAYSLGLCDISKSGAGVYSRGVEISLGYFFLNTY
ncbi:MAG: PorT family protein [Prevotellaceae bacterium]|jgi:hypothetical protein|nr:PorT family protein [Prevotellaceae bacterium]